MSRQLKSPRLSSTASAPDRVRDRLHGLDWLRAAAALLVVVLHASIPYMTQPLPGLVWSVSNQPQSAAVNAVAWWIDGFVMPLFFLMTGFFAARLMKQRGPDAFVRHRVKRLGGPLLLAMVLILPLDLYAWLLGWVNSGQIPPVKLKSLKVDPPLSDALWGVSHLWYLEYVLLYCVGAWGLKRVADRLRLPDVTKNVLENVKARGGQSLRWLFVGVVIAGACLWWQPRIVIGFRHGWLPYWENLTYYAIPFCLGWFWNANPMANAVSRRDWGLRFLAAQLLFVALLFPRLQNHLAAETTPVSDPWVPLLFAAFGLLSATSVFGLALSLRFQKPSPVVTYVSQASFWIYLLHHPLVGLTHVDLALVPLMPFAEMLLAFVTATCVCLLTYEVAVRRTFIGLVLNGIREVRLPRSRETVMPLEAGSEQPQKQAA